jgi:hypothetical protein
VVKIILVVCPTNHISYLLVMMRFSSTNDIIVMNQSLRRKSRTLFSNTFYSGSQIHICFWPFEYFINDSVKYRRLAIQKCKLLSTQEQYQKTLIDLCLQTDSDQCWSCQS